jgi:DNA mismatch repair protein MutS2
VATTHLGQLKLLATQERGIINASLQFDADRLVPTYRLVKGVPGRSYGLAIARRLGLPRNVLETAEATLPQGERDISRLLLELEAKEQRLDEHQLRMERMIADTERIQAELKERERGLQQREKDAERRARQQARDLLLKAREEVEAAIGELRASAEQGAMDDAARAARRRVEEAAKRQRERAPDQRRAKAGAPAAKAKVAPELAAGVRVRIESLGRTGTVVEVRDGKATVEAGSLRLNLPSDDLTPLAPGDQEPKQRKPQAGYFVHSVEARPEVDLRGMRVDEVETVLGRAVDDAILSGLPSFRIIHGKGTGALRAHVRDLLKADRRISTARPGELFEGGTGVTVVEFA